MLFGVGDVVFINKRIVDADNIFSVVDDKIPVGVSSFFEDVELGEIGVENAEYKLRFDVEVAVVEDAELTEVVFIDA